MESPDFTFQESVDVIDCFKNGKCRDTLGFIQEIFKRRGKSLFLSLFSMMNMIKRFKVFSNDWFKMASQTILKKKNRSLEDLNNYHGIFIVPILSLIFERLLKNRITPHLENNKTQFQTGGVKGKAFQTT